MYCRNISPFVPLTISDTKLHPFQVIWPLDGHTPLWVRPESLCLDNLYDGTSVKQIVGHTSVKEICDVAGVILVDCLDMTEKSYKVSCL